MKKYFALLFICFSIYSNANVQLPLLFSDGMVLQRDKPIPVWGWADVHEKIEVHFNNQIVKTQADKNGKWIVRLKAEMAGGPYKMVIKGKNIIDINNVLVGEVWICSGQSNMEFTVNSAMNSKQEMNDSDFPMIRQFMVEKDLSATPKAALKAAKWDVCNKSTVGNFTAIGYFFAKKLYAELKIPIGIINTSWGGTNVETWTSREAFENSDEFKEMIAQMPKIDIGSLSKNQIKSVTEKIEKIQGSKINASDQSYFKELSFNDANWPEMQAPELWENQQLSNFDGVVWMRKSFVISKEDAAHEALLELAKIDDMDVTYINGIEVGTTNNYDEKRVYEIPVGTLNEGNNVIAIKIVDYAGGGGIWGDASDLKLSLQSTVIPLSGKWKFNVTEITSEVSPNSYPSLLYNAMINPLIPYAFQGVLWYQGEANVGRAEQYKKAFPLMITDWRTKWNQGDFPFYFVQLSSFDEFGGNSNKGSKWAELREAQTYTLQTVANTGMAVTTDIGNAKDIHPTNKQEVGKRLSAIALHNIYNKKIISSGPAFKSLEIKENQITITFDNIGSGLMTTDKYGYIKGFEIAGADKVFHYAKAYIIDNKVIVYNENVSNPVAIHYGWADDAGDCNLYNKEEFPASPFRTDDWDMVTKGEKYTFENLNMLGD
jgi:sialate O-acetylesterase